MTKPGLIPEKTAVLVVDIQGDFTELKNGSLAVAGADQAYVDQVAAAAAEAGEKGFQVFATQDWHPAGHISFCTNNPGATPFDLLDLDGRTQVMWPPHCVQGTENAGLLLDAGLFDGVVQKGMNPEFDSYSGFFDDGGHSTGLDDMLKSGGIEVLVVFGLTLDYCARATAVDGRKLGFQVYLVQDLCRAVAEDTGRAAVEEMRAAGVNVLSGLPW